MSENRPARSFFSWYRAFRNGFIRSGLLLLLGLQMPVSTAIAGASAAPTVEWVGPLVQVSDTGLVRLQWRTGDGRQADLYRLLERRGNEEFVSYVSGDSITVFRGQPGTYEFQLQACLAGGPGERDCGRKSRRASVEVTESVLAETPDAQEARQRLRDGLPPEETLADGPHSLQPGLWFNPERNGHGWSFYWNNRLSLPETDAVYGNTWDLVGTWYTYEAKTRFLDGPPPCGEGGFSSECYWVHENYRPFWARLNLVQTGMSSYQGAVIVRRNGVEIHVGAATVEFTADNRSAIIHWAADFRYQQLQATDSVVVLAGSDPSRVDDDSHYSGAWRPRSAATLEVVDTLGGLSEAIEVLFEEAAGDPSWIQASNAWPPTAEATDFCFYYVLEGYAPDGQGQPSIYEDGCDASVPASVTNRNGWRMFSGFEELRLWGEFDLPQSAGGGQLRIGSATSPQLLEKHSGLNRVEVRSGSEGCQIPAGQEDCAVLLTWIVAGDYPLASVFGRHLESGELRRLAMAGHAAEGDFSVALDRPGRWQFELRMGDTVDSSLMAVSASVEVIQVEFAPPSTPAAGWLDPAALAWRVSWTHPDSAAVERYELEENLPTGSAMVHIVSPGTLTQLDFSRPQGPFGEYRYRVRACIGGDCSGWSGSAPWTLPEPPGSGGGGDTVNPWQAIADEAGSLVTDVGYHYAMGYHFRPLEDGEVTELGGLFNGNKQVKLFERYSRKLLAVAWVSANNDWSYAAIAPVSVSAGAEYTVAVYLDGSGGSYRTALAVPATSGPVEILASAYAYTAGNLDAFPANSSTTRMYGQADIGFRAGTPPPQNQAPVLTAPPNQLNTVGDVVELQVDASDPDGDPVSCQFDGLPAGLQGSAACRVQGTVTEPAAQFTVTVTATDGQDSSGPVQFSWEIRPRGRSASPETPPDPAGRPDFEVDDASVGVGAAAGDSWVDERGGFNYRIPLMTAPGSGGFAPNLALEYHSQAPNDVAGVGWSLTGLSSITRCPQTVEQDGISANRPVRLDNGDRFCLDGERLMVVSGSYGADGAEYRTELDRHLRIVSHGAVDGGPARFTVWHGDGGFSEYGRREDARVATRVGGGAPSATLVWAISRRQDASGNYFDFDYHKSVSGPVEATLEKVRYTGNARAGVPPWAELRFHYETGRADVPVRFVSGAAIQRTRLLKRVESVARVRAEDSAYAPVRHYELSHGQDGHGRPVLESVEECSDASGRHCFPPTRFGWLKTEHAISTSGVPVGRVFDRQMRGLGIADIDGDARPDLLVIQQHRKDLQFAIAWAGSEDGFALDAQRYGIPNDGDKESPVRMLTADLDGDGLQDVIYPKSLDGQVVWMARLSDGSGLGSEVTAIAACCGQLKPAIARVLDYNGDGRPDLLTSRPDGTPGGRSELVVLINRGDWSSAGGFDAPRVLSVDYDPSLFPDGPTAEGWRLNPDPPRFLDVVTRSAAGATPVDFNGDGRVDLLARIGRRYEKCQDDCTVQQVRDNAAGSGPFVIQSEDEPPGDFQPDGVNKALASFYVLFEAVADDRFVMSGVISTGHGLDCSVPEACGPWSHLPAARQMLPVDINGDGLADFAHRDGEHAWWYRLNTGTGLGEPVRVSPALEPDLSRRGQFVDLGGDGLPEFLVPDRSGSDAAEWRTYPNDGGGGFGAEMPTGIRAGDSGEGDVSILLDFTADGLLDHLFLDFEKGQPSEPGTQLHGGRNLLTGSPGEASNLLTSVTSSTGAETRVSYGSLTDPAVYTPFRDASETRWGRSSAVFDLLAPIEVVRALTRSAPTLGSAAAVQEQAYYYAGGKVQAGGRGFLGFAEVVTWDPQSSLRSHARYRQDFPFVGALAESAVFRADSAERFDLMGPNRAVASTPFTEEYQPSIPAVSELLRYTRNAWVAREPREGAGAWWRAPGDTLYRSQTLGGSLDKKELTQRTHDDHGREERVVVTTWGSDDSPAYASVDTERRYAEPDHATWNRGRVTEIQVRHERRGQLPILRRSEFAYDAATGLMTRETTEPGDPGLQVVTAHTLDSWGNRIRTSVQGTGMAARNSEVDHDGLGRFVVESRNHFGQRTSRTLQWDVFGTPLVTLDINGVRTESVADPLGWSFASWSETGAWSRATRRRGAGGLCPASTAFREMQHAGGTPGSYRCYDRLGREIRSARVGFDGRYVLEDRDHDASGRVVRTTEPYFAGEPRFWNSVEYDALGRITAMQSADGDQLKQFYDEQVAGACGISGPRAVLAENAKQQDRIEVRDPLGQVLVLFDANCGRTTYEHDSIGNLVQVTGPDGVSTAMQYDAAGRKVGMHDPDKGYWRYAWNALGEMTRQLDAKGQAMDFEYDALGRVVRRTERSGVSGLGDLTGTPLNEENTSWQNAVGASVTGKGQVVLSAYGSLSDQGSLHRVQTGYDRFGRRVLETTEQGGMKFAREWTYDQYGRVFQEFDASGDFRGVRHVYSESGYPARIRESREGTEGRVYREIHAMDARGRVLHATLGNGVETFAEYEPVGGDLVAQRAYDRNGLELQDLRYAFDALGNLVQRADRSNGLDVTEDFRYDELNRLVGVHRTAPSEGLSNPAEVLSLQYTTGGNIAWKSDVGAYLYGQNGVGEHAVTSAGGVRYDYDANGNQVGGGGRTLSYSAFDKPLRIARGGQSTEFTYGVGKRRIERRDDNAVDGVRITHYVGSTEFVTDSRGSRFRRLLGGAVVAEFFPSTGAESFRFAVSDHLGSTHVLTGDDGDIASSTWMSFDAFGQRREAHGGGLLGLAELALWNAITTRGFTGHEHVDGLGIIHMNGRVYDPSLGRFLQADPYLPGAPDSQSLNRYSYALNNPVSYSDPSGYFLKRFLNRWGRLIAAIALSVVLPGPQGLLASYLGVTNIYLQAAMTGFVAGAVASGTLRGAVIGSLTALAVTGVVQAFSNGVPDTGLADAGELTPESAEIPHLYGPDGPPAGLYRIHVQGDGALIKQYMIQSDSIVSGDFLVVNGMSNNFSAAIRNATSHLYQTSQLGNSYVLYFNPTQSFLPDLGEALVDMVGAHFGGAHSSLARNLAQTLDALSLRGVSGIHLVGHSQGGAIAASALRYARSSGMNLSSLAGGSLALHGAPVNAWLTGRQVTGPSGIGLVSRAQFGDAVHVLGGLNISNPLELPVAILRFPALFSADPGLSPHTLPCGSRSVLCAP